MEAVWLLVQNNGGSMDTGPKQWRHVEQAHSIFYILQDYSSLTFVERRGGWVLEVVVVVREQEMDNY